MCLEKRLSWGFVTLFRTCQAMSIAITTVLPEPVAIFEQSLRKGPRSPRISMPCREAAGASMSQISVSIASSWQKKNRRSSQPSRSRQCRRSRSVIPVMPGLPASRHSETLDRI